jgi:drug/metabolite transporter (DMT)-like permease
LTAHKSLLKPSIELLLATAFWGAGFPATVWILQDLNPASNLFYRLQLCFWLTLLIFIFLKKTHFFNLQLLKLSLLPGFFLGFNLILQTIGLQYTTATKSAFITILYVVMIPVIEFLFDRTKITLHLGFSIVIALLGVHFVSQFDGTNINWGDFLTLISALAAAFQIYFVGKVAQKIPSVMTFNALQSVMASLMMMPFLFFETKRDLWSLSTQGWIGFAITVLGGSMLAFGLQIKAQKEISASLAGILFLVESPFAFFFAYFMLGERLSSVQFLGCFLILFACSYAVFFAHPRKV